MKEDAEVSELMAGVLSNEGVRLLVNNRLASASSGETLMLRVEAVTGSESSTDVE